MTAIAQLSVATLGRLNIEELREIFQDLAQAERTGSLLLGRLQRRLADEAHCQREQPASADMQTPGESSFGVVTASEQITSSCGWSLADLVKFVPVRLSEDERRKLAILERALEISEYTDKVDIYIRGFGRRDAAIEEEIGKFESIVRGLVMSQGEAGSLMTASDGGGAQTIAEISEVGRRYKMANPSKMRNTYGKLMWLLQDRVRIKSDCVIPEIYTIRSCLTSEHCTKIVNDPAFIAACVKDSEAARKSLLAKYADDGPPAEAINRAIDSFRDFFALEGELLEPVRTLRGLLIEFFGNSNLVDAKNSLGITAGVNGARLTHSHRRQYDYVLQSLTLWEEVLKRFMPLWHRAESDLLDSSCSYRLMDTGQGLNRVQHAPKVLGFISKILAHTQALLAESTSTGWVGSSVIHLGDHNVPNAFFFIDKYSQIPRILGPVAHVVRKVEYEYLNTWDDRIKAFVDAVFGGPTQAKRAILADFFKHAFDGSGADNFFDAGSCIDGRLTSAWNWCSKIESKSYYPLFLLCGFTGFDGA